MTFLSLRGFAIATLLSALTPIAVQASSGYPGTGESDAMTELRARMIEPIHGQPMPIPMPRASSAELAEPGQSDALATTQAALDQPLALPNQSLAMTSWQGTPQFAISGGESAAMRQQRLDRSLTPEFRYRH
ncbi:hypothetical protein [Kushneria phosphatilytica]|uniref:Uncharacterized protein n=1 Tax=Kushneria phosphatilytica TaxID=657387 RepID=A0A1S1NQ01_9GAMM|nr:hypothetical protein [Kushneria phosphatilytica]OHV10504.1 hypothetical protein BH688_08800 [Kushneria phosphatilytica]QEL11940.1 hypothetical protein FY550_12870 [Kushneria phosphatilytica]